jgi:hypothetical protein
MLIPVPQFDLLLSMKSKEKIISDYIGIYIAKADANNKLEDALRHVEEMD